LEHLNDFPVLTNHTRHKLNALIDLLAFIFI
jgi:hypothetical protein